MSQYRNNNTVSKLFWSVLFEEFLNKGKMPAEKAYFPMDLKSTKEAYEVWLDVPGFHKSSIKIVYKDQVLTISGDRTLVDETDLSISERHKKNSFTRNIKLNTTIDISKVKTSLFEGTLHIILPKVVDQGVNIPL